MRIAILTLALFSVGALCGENSAPTFVPTEEYTQREIKGFTVYLSPELLTHKPEADAAQAELEAQLGRVKTALSEEQFEKLKRVKFWLEWGIETKRACAEYHPDPGWVKRAGRNPEKAKCVEISNAKTFVDWSHGIQPWMILHELAHAYHFQVLGDRHPGILAAYKNAMDKKLYDTVEYAGGGKKKAYACTNEKEYFAENCEAWFGKNDFFPFTRADLEKHDPECFKLMKEIWGDPKSPK